jgi:hypothetical protein
MTAREIAAALGNARPSGKDWRCLCPLCDHNNPTLCDDGGRLVVRCLSGCASQDVHKELCCRHLGGNGRANGNGNGNRVAALETCTPGRAVDRSVERGLDIAGVAQRLELRRRSATAAADL